MARDAESPSGGSCYFLGATNRRGIDTLVKLAIALDIDPADLMDGIDWKPGETVPGHFDGPGKRICVRSRPLQWVSRGLPEALEETEEALEAKGLAVLARDGEGEYDEKRIIPTKGAPDLRSLFEEWQVLVVNDWIDRVAAATATQIFEMSHHHPGWLLAKKNGETIPYETAILPQSRPTALEASRAKEVARGRGWQSSDGKWLWERSVN